MEHVTYEQYDRVGTVTIDREATHNTLNTAVLDELREAFKRPDEDVSVVVLSSGGTEAFSFGAELEELTDATDEEYAAFQENGASTLETIADHPAIVIAAVDGDAYGGGMELTLAVDLVVANVDATFALPEVSIGLVPGGGGTQRLPRIIGTRLAKELLVTGEPVTATVAKQHGLVNRVAEDDAFETAMELAETIAGNAPLAVREIKRVVDQGTQQELREALTLEAERSIALYQTADAREGIAAFQENRDPEFEGE